jgi:predicted RNA binding protein YcfA (HicA-like mRNA interferase family)
VSRWPATKASRVFQALLRIGWTPKPGAKGSGSHVRLTHPNFPYTYTWAFHDSVEIGPKMLGRIAKHTGLKPENL